MPFGQLAKSTLHESGKVLAFPNCAAEDQGPKSVLVEEPIIERH
jgi:hypothetical protein